jgi:ribonucleoside-diphosphate reductase alpha chain
MTRITKNRKSYIQELDFDVDRLSSFVDEIVEETGKSFDKTEIESLKQKLIEEIQSKSKFEASKILDLLIREANDMISVRTPQYAYLSARTLLRKLYKEASKNRGFDYRQGYGDYYTFVKMMTEQGIYDETILKSYTKEEIDEAGKLIDISKDKQYSYAGLFLLNKSYLAKGYNGETLELPQERALSTALYLMSIEDKEDRMKHVSESYFVLSNQFIGLATPTLLNSSRPMGTLSSCHILTMDDSLQSISDVWKDVSTFSQNGAGIGIALHNLRADGSWIRGYKGLATGVIGAMKVLNSIAEYVNQGGKRKAGISVYLPVHHADIYDFLDARLKTGSQERRTHSLFTGVCISDEFMRRLEKRTTWTLFDPYEVKQKLGFDLNYMYDKHKLKDWETPNPIDHEFTYHYRLAEQSDLELSRVVEAKEIYGKIYTSRKTGGTPYIFYTDTANRLNPNSHEGFILCSNLCTEIMLNTHYDTMSKDTLDPLTGIVTQQKIGKDLVTCNLSSRNLYNIFTSGVDLQRVVDIQFRMLDNVISLNRTPVLQATHTNMLYRAVGSGDMGLANLLAENKLYWDSDEAGVFINKLFEKIHKANIKASNKLALEKGSYPLFKGSDWETGEYYEKRGLNSDEWLEIKEISQTGMRNCNLSAIAPTSSNAVISNCIPSVDAPYEVIYNEEKAGMKVPMIPVNYNAETMWYFKSAFEMDEMWSIKNIAIIQKHVDQAISHNMHLHKSVKASEMLRLDMGAWEMGMKTVYYTYSDTNDINRSEGCVACES